jgi:hypothetical protein
LMKEYSINQFTLKQNKQKTWVCNYNIHNSTNQAASSLLASYQAPLN